MGFPWTEQVTQGMTIAAAGLHPTSQAAGTYLTSPADLKKFRKLVFVMDVGALGTSGTCTLQLQAATTSGGTYSNITGAVSATISTNNQYAFVEVSADFVQNVMGAGYEFVKGQLTVAGSTSSLVGVAVLGAVGESEPTSGYADASLASTVAVGA